MLESGPGKERASGVGRDVFMVALALVSIAILIYDELAHPIGESRKALILLDSLIVIVFALEFVMGLVQSSDRKRYWRSHWWELPGLMPMAVGEASFLRAFRLVRLVRVIRIVRVVSVASRLKRTRRVAGGFLARSHLATTITVTTSLLVGAAYAAWLFERDANPMMFSSFKEALWWAVVTAATVGYGDIYPVTDGGRIVATILMFTGVGLIAVLASTFAMAIGRVPSAPTMASWDSRLAELARLHKDGDLTDEEFEAAKSRLLNEPTRSSGPGP